MVVDEGLDNNENLDSDDTILTLGLVVFNVQITNHKSIIESDTAINIAQWNYLIKVLAPLMNIPPLPTEENVYLLQASVEEGEVTFSWIVKD